MKKHKIFQNKLLRFIDGSVSAKEKQGIQLHIEKCEKCRKDVELLSDAWNRVQHIKRVQSSPFLWNKILFRLTDKTQKELWVYKAAVFIRQTAQPALTAAIVVFGLFIGIKFGNRLTMEDLSSQQSSIKSFQPQSEFGLENFQVLPSGTLGWELATLMDYKNK